MSIVPEGKLIWGLQLPVQTLTESRREPWELDGTVADVIAVAQTVEAAGGSVRQRVRPHRDSRQ